MVFTDDDSKYRTDYDNPLRFCVDFHGGKERNGPGYLFTNLVDEGNPAITHEPSTDCGPDGKTT